jgi:hypothetical protein
MATEGESAFPHCGNKSTEFRDRALNSRPLLSSIRGLGFAGMMPLGFHGHAVYVTGVCEIAGAVVLLFPDLRRTAASIPLWP